MCNCVVICCFKVKRNILGVKQMQINSSWLLISKILNAVAISQFHTVNNMGDATKATAGKGQSQQVFL